MPHFLRKLKMVPILIYYKIKGKKSRDYAGQWDSFWSTVKKTGTDGEVIWDTSDMTETHLAFDKFSKHMDLSLPILDLGCGNGRRSRFLAERCPRVIGVDVSASAIKLAKEESAGYDNLEFRVVNATDISEAQKLHREFEDLNIFMRGVFHAIKGPDRPAFVSNIRTLLGDRGALYQIETDSQVLDYMLARPDPTPTGLPRLMQNVVQHGLLPEGFGPEDLRRWYPESEWQIFESGDDEITMLDFSDGAARAPAHYVIAKPRSAN